MTEWMEDYILRTIFYTNNLYYAQKLKRQLRMAEKNLAKN